MGNVVKFSAARVGIRTVCKKVFVKKIGSEIVISAVHVDDCLVTGSSATFKFVNKFKFDMNKKYKFTDLG